MRNGRESTWQDDFRIRLVRVEENDEDDDNAELTEADSLGDEA